MADVTSSEGDNRLVVTAENCRATAAKGIGDDGEEDKTTTENSIYEILESMTNEFNKSVCSVNNEKVETEKAATPSLPLKVVYEKSKEEKKSDVINEETASTQEVSVLEENHKSGEDSSTDKPEPVKKDGGLTRIVLTFRTIDENTDHGKKTKISSCSNLTLVPDELVNCDQFGGVSVKIENSDENLEDSNVRKESETEESQSDKTKEAESEEKEEIIKAKEFVEEKESTNEQESTKEIESKTIETDQVEDAVEKSNGDAQSQTQEKSETVENNVESNNVEAVLAEATEQQEPILPTPPITRKRRAGRPRLRALRFFYFSLLLLLAKHFKYIFLKSLFLSNVFSESIPQDEEQPGPKRSARRLSKESLKSTVLESAIARKEKSNYTEEHSKKRKYSKPGRPKKVVQAKDQTKQGKDQTQAKLSDVRQDLETSLLSDNISTPESSMLESSHNTTLSDNINDSIIEDSQSDFDGMPKLSPMTRNSDTQNKLNNSIGSPESDDIPLADIEKPFLKPATSGRPKRERGRPRGSNNQGARKIAKSDAYEGDIMSIYVSYLFLLIKLFSSFLFSFELKLTNYFTQTILYPLQKQERITIILKVKPAVL